MRNKDAKVTPTDAEHSEIPHLQRSKVEAVSEHWFSRRCHCLKGSKQYVFWIDSASCWVTQEGA